MWTKSKYVNAYIFPEILNVKDVLLHFFAISSILNAILLFNFPNRKMWETSMKGLLSLVRRTSPSSFAYISEKVGYSFVDKVMHSVQMGSSEFWSCV